MAINTKHSELCHGWLWLRLRCVSEEHQVTTDRVQYSRVGPALEAPPSPRQHSDMSSDMQWHLKVPITLSTIITVFSPQSPVPVPVPCPLSPVPCPLSLISDDDDSDPLLPRRPWLSPCKLLNGDFFLPQVMRIIVRDFLLKLGYYGNYFVTFYWVISNDHPQSKLY